MSFALLSLRLSLALVLGGGAAGASPSGPWTQVTRARYLMGSVCEGVVYAGPDPSAKAHAAAGLEAAFEEIARLEAVLSDYKSDSELSRLNREGFPGPFACSADLYDFLSQAARYSHDTGGAFDITVAPLVTLWDLRGPGRLPEPAQVRATLDRVGISKLKLDASSRRAAFGSRGMAVDPGALGKGYALDAAAGVLRSRGITSALLDFGGQVIAIGAPPGTEAWEVSLAHPSTREEPALTLELRDASISTSGNSERWLKVGQRDIGHVLDPRTGEPSAARGSASAIAPTGAEADAASTAMLVMGPERGLVWASARPHLSIVFLESGEAGQVRVRATPNVNLNRPAPPSSAGVRRQKR